LGLPLAKLPAFQFYPGDWRKDPGVQSLSFHDRGIWFEILCLMHESEYREKLLLNGHAMPEDALARLLGLDNQILTKALTTLLTYGVASLCPDTAALMSRRMVRDEEIRQVRISCGKLGGNPNLVNQNPTTQVKVNPTPSARKMKIEDLGSSPKEQSPGQVSPKVEFWDPICRIFGMKPVTARDDDRLWQHCQDFKAKGATVEELEKRAGIYRDRHPGVAFTPNAVLNNWDFLGQPLIPSTNGKPIPKKSKAL